MIIDLLIRTENGISVCRNETLITFVPHQKLAYLTDQIT